MIWYVPSSSFYTTPSPIQGTILDWNYCLEDVWWPRNRYQQKRRVLSDDETTEDLRGITVPVEYYSRHQLLRGDSPSYILPPSSQNQKGSPVYTYRPGTPNQVPKIWPSRAHGGSMEPKQQDTTNLENAGTKKWLKNPSCKFFLSINLKRFFPNFYNWAFKTRKPCQGRISFTPNIRTLAYPLNLSKILRFLVLTDYPVFLNGAFF
ncbi:uncharacterized protein TNIN_84551 [Trichonephila inaurata madagascariensis]|uniref:Uncharacterized protein n=1 Tax=Trichonephila inaurata madagascariensis TaxID=2747483 RepID=A0A8X6MLD2_9ARAC|nr:uncharacterized protein TNIN_84551 [Trichonephila inaurata madagascariensis]